MKPVDHIRMLYEQFSSLNDDELIAKITALPVLPDEDHPLWDNDATWEEHGHVYVALLDLAAERKLLSTISLFLERSCYGDPGEMMRGIHHSFEYMVNPDWDALAKICIEMAQHPLRGARLWSIEQLGRLRIASTIDAVIKALTDEAELVREQARSSLWMIAKANPECRPAAIQALLEVIADYQTDAEKREASKDLKEIEAMD
jgi:hypothetical protein